MVAYKQYYPELKVKLMIGGWGKNADGFDIDWEYPTYAAHDGDHYNGASPEDYVNFVTLFKEMREAMPDKILSYAASDSGKYREDEYTQ